MTTKTVAIVAGVSLLLGAGLLIAQDRGRGFGPGGPMGSWRDDLVTLIEGDAHEKVSQVQGPLDLWFIDADKEGASDYLTKLLPKVRPGGLIVAHNISPGMAAPKFLAAITTNPDLETVFYQQGGGVSVTLKKREL